MLPPDEELCSPLVLRGKIVPRSCFEGRFILHSRFLVLRGLEISTLAFGLKIYSNLSLRGKLCPEPASRGKLYPEPVSRKRNTLILCFCVCWGQELYTILFFLEGGRNYMPILRGKIIPQFFFWRGNYTLILILQFHLGAIK